MSEQQSEIATGGSAEAQGSADALKKERARGYGCGYAAAMKRVNQLECEISRLKQLKEPPEAHEATIEYLLTASEVFTKAASVMIRMRMDDPPNNG